MTKIQIYVAQAYSVIFRVVQKEVGGGFCSGEKKFFLLFQYILKVTVVVSSSDPPFKNTLKLDQQFDK